MKSVSWNVDEPARQSPTLPPGCPECYTPHCDEVGKCKQQSSKRPHEILDDRYKKALRRSFKNKTDLHSVESLLYYGCDANNELRNGETALLAATYWRDVDFMTTFVDTYGANTNQVLEKISSDGSLKSFFNMFLNHRKLARELKECQEKLLVEQKDIDYIVSELPPETDGKLLREMLARAIRQTEHQHKLLAERDEMLRLLENPSSKRRRIMK